MKRIIIILGIIAVVADTCGQTTKKQDTNHNTVSREDTLIKLSKTHGILYLKYDKELGLWYEPCIIDFKNNDTLKIKNFSYENGSELHFRLSPNKKYVVIDNIIKGYVEIEDDEELYENYMCAILDIINANTVMTMQEDCGGEWNGKNEWISGGKVIFSPNLTSYKMPTKFYIKDKTKYSKQFISEFKKYHGIYETVSLIEDTIIINNDRKELIIIPTDLPLNKIIVYKNEDKENEQTLSVKRVNISTLEYNYYKIVNGRKVNERQGKADLQPIFYYGAEGTFEDKDENIYGMNRYIDYSEKDCWTYIYIGVRSIEKSFLIYGCENDRYKFRTTELIKKVK